jgi:hypothetical protein
MSATIRFGDNTRKENVTSFSLQVLKEILQAAGLSSAVISSTSRTPADQARVMFENLESTSAEAQKKLF